MSTQSFVDFLREIRDDPALLAQFSQRNLSQLIFHAKNRGFEFSPGDVAAVVTLLEMNTITVKDKEDVSGSSGLWRRMWGRRHLDYLVQHVVARFDDGELQGEMLELAGEVRS